MSCTTGVNKYLSACQRGVNNAGCEERREGLVKIGVRVRWWATNEPNTISATVKPRNTSRLFKRSFAGVWRCGGRHSQHKRGGGRLKVDLKKQVADLLAEEPKQEKKEKKKRKTHTDTHTHTPPPTTTTTIIIVTATTAFDGLTRVADACPAVVAAPDAEVLLGCEVADAAAAAVVVAAPYV